jgi:hypothetical protein
MSGQLHAPAALPLGKELSATIGQEAAWAPEPVWTLWRGEKSCTARNRTRAFQPVAIPSKLSRLVAVLPPSSETSCCLRTSRCYMKTKAICSPKRRAVFEIHGVTMNMETICCSETSVDFQRTTRRYIPEDRTVHNHPCENLKSYICFFPALIVFLPFRAT